MSHIPHNSTRVAPRTATIPSRCSIKVCCLTECCFQNVLLNSHRSANQYEICSDFLCSNRFVHDSGFRVGFRTVILRLHPTNAISSDPSGVANSPLPECYMLPFAQYFYIHFLLILWGKEGRHFFHFSEGETETSEVMPWPNVLWLVLC